MKVYISSSWKNRKRVRTLADTLRAKGLEPFDFTDPRYRSEPDIPPERFPEPFDPQVHNYREYLNRPEWRAAVEGNRHALDNCDVCVLLLPCGADAHSDWAYAVGRGKRSIVVGTQRAGERTPTHWWADTITESDEATIALLQDWKAAQDVIARAGPGPTITWDQRSCWRVERKQHVAIVTEAEKDRRGGCRRCLSPVGQPHTPFCGHIIADPKHYTIHATALSPDGTKTLAVFEAPTPGALLLDIGRSGLVTSVEHALWLGAEVERVARKGAPP